MAPLFHTFTLNTGDEMPAIGLGTWRSDRSRVSKAVETALRTGYRHIDTALAYGNEREVGAGIRASSVPREEIWVSGKLRNNWHKHVRQCVKKSLRNLGLDYFDMYLIHWPCSRNAENPAACYTDWDFVDTWVEMQKLVDEDKVRNIGVSNFGIQHLDRLLNSPSTYIELHPCNPSPKLVAYNTSKGIHTEGYSCLGSAGSILYRNKTLLDIAEAKEKTPQQVLLQWGLQKGWSVVPKSVTPSRIESNLDLDGWELTDDEMTALDGIQERFKVVSDGFLPMKVFFGDDE
ncbi:aldehyde reductase 1 [Fusarium heterosporum]|uniref:Aldehyde reductase 1 n=1 Tax=Fusarium heterosporum TaxID=42747 RepID=A0A8H5TTH9_FUSHE|nr:aldehyde reductase 1 [Fusarium heterosporum]